MKSLFFLLIMVSTVPWMIVMLEQAHYQELTIQALVRKSERESLCTTARALGRNWYASLIHPWVNRSATFMLGRAQVRFSLKQSDGSVILITNVVGGHWYFSHEEVIATL